MILNKLTYFYPEKPQLILIDSRAMDEMSKDDDFIAEPKFNEQRCELHLIDGVGHFWDRHGKELSYNTNPANAEGKKEIVRILVDKFGDKGYFLFDAGLRHNKVSGIKDKLVIYDIHVRNGELLNKIPFMRRRFLLEQHFEVHELNYLYDTVHLIYQYPDNFRKLFNELTAQDCVDESFQGTEEFEGIVIKNLNGKLKLGRRSGNHSMWMFKVRIQTGRHRY